MRYLAESFAPGALRRGRSVEQFLGPIHTAERLGVRYVEIRPKGGRYEIFLHVVEDVSHKTLTDLVEFPPLDQDDEEQGGFALNTIAEGNTLDQLLEAGATTARTTKTTNSITESPLPQSCHPRVSGTFQALQEGKGS